MRAYIIRRLLLMIPTLLIVTIIVFLTVRLIPGNIVDIMVSEMGFTAGNVGVELTKENLRHMLGLDVPVYTQYLSWLGGIFHGDLGISLWRRTDVTAELGAAMPVSLELGILALITAILFAVPVGVYSAMRQDTAGDYIGRTISILAISLPSFWLATIVIVYGSIYLNWLPAVGYVPFFRDPLGSLGQFIVPAVILGTVLSGNTMRMARTMMLEILRQDYIRTAWSKGLTERTVIIRHALKNSLIPVVTMIGLLVPVVIGGSAVIEQIFALPGLGRLLLQSINTRDYPVISGINLVLATVILIMNLIIDVSYAWLDPRIKYQ